jgi:hypothetical protein
MARSRTRSRNRRIALVISGVTIVGAGAAIGMGTTFAAEKDRGVCNGLAKAKANNEKFIAAQEELAKQNPDQAAVFQGRVENRRAVIGQIDSRLKAAGCDDAAAGQSDAADDQGANADDQGEDADDQGEDADDQGEDADDQGENAAAGQGGDIGCDNLAQAKANNEKFIAAQEQLAQQNPDQAAVFEGRVENRRAVIGQIDSRLKAAGCV